MCMGIWPVCMSEYHMHAVPTENRKKALDSLGLERHTFMSCCVGPGNQTWDLDMCSQCSEARSCLSRYLLLFPMVAPCNMGNLFAPILIAFGYPCWCQEEENR